MQTPPKPRSKLSYDADDTEPGRSWAHASGWALLSGTRRTISCVIVCQDQARALNGLLPALSDTLTECGYPWEVIVVDRDSKDSTHRLLALWCDLPGFRWSRCDAGLRKTPAVVVGLRDTRGDAVILVDPAARAVAACIPSMILRWEAGARLVCDAHGVGSSATQLLSLDAATLQRESARDTLDLLAERTACSLLDRRLVDRVLTHV